MKWFSKMNIGTKLGLGFGSILFLMVILGVFSIMQVAKMNGNTVDIATNWLPSVKVLADLKFETSAFRRDTLNYIVATDKRQHYEDKTVAEISAIADGISSDEERKIYQEFREQWDKYVPVNTRVKELAKQNKNTEAVTVMQSEGSQSFEAAAKYLQEDIELNNKGAADSTSAAAATYISSRYWVIGILIGALALGSIVAFTLARALASSATAMLDVIEEVAGKNLTVKDMVVISEDEIGRAGMALNGMKNNLHEMIQSIRGTAEQVAAASEELSATGQQITANSEETTAQAQVVSQAGHQVNTNLQTLASGAEEMNSTIGEIAKNATEAARVSGEAVEAANSANQTVLKLGDSSVEIEKVIEVITSIAQQTNLLALNATIEAARAGEAGKGFAVVANEVKELAKQTAKATEEIKQKIAIIREDTGGAVTAIGGIKGVIDKVSHISTVIATAVEEQSATTSEMARNVTEAARGAATISENIKGVADAAQSTSTNVGESQTASEHLSKMANQLRDLVGQFKVGDDGTRNQRESPSSKAAGRAAGAR
jgi:methyl-accepting chemotaxis protein